MTQPLPASSTPSAQATARPFPIPVNYFAMALGTGALGAAWRAAASAGMTPAWVGEAILAFTAVVWLILIAAMVVALLNFRQWLREQWAHPVRCCFFSLIPATTAQMGATVFPYLSYLGYALAILGALGQLYFASHRIAGMWRGTHVAEATTPVLYLPTVATNFATATAMGMMGWKDAAMFFFGAGLISWFSVESAILNRLRNLAPMNVGERGLMGVQLAPPFVGGNAYLAANGGIVDWFFLIMTGYGILQLIFLMRLLPWIMEGGFSMSLWGFSFGMGAMVSTGVHLSAANVVNPLGIVLMVIGTGFLVFLWGGVAYVTSQGRLLVRPS